jgi:hypothetical protein
MPRVRLSRLWRLALWKKHHKPSLEPRA